MVLRTKIQALACCSHDSQYAGRETTHQHYTFTIAIWCERFSSQNQFESSDRASSSRRVIYIALRTTVICKCDESHPAWFNTYLPVDICPFTFRNAFCPALRFACFASPSRYGVWCMVMIRVDAFVLTYAHAQTLFFGESGRTWVPIKSYQPINVHLYFDFLIGPFIF